MYCRFGTKHLREATEDDLINPSSAPDAGELVDVSSFYRNSTTLYLDNPIFDSLVLYYCDNYEYFKNEKDYIIWKLKYGL